MKKGEIWLIELPSTGSNEQSGLRPVIVMAEADAAMAFIIPLTSNLQALRYPNTILVKATNRNCLKNNSVALVFQLRSIDRKRLLEKTGLLEPEHLSKASQMVSGILGL